MGRADQCRFGTLLWRNSWGFGGCARQGFQLGKLALSEGKFLGSAPSLELTFALDGRGLVRERLGINQFDRWGIPSGFASIPAEVFLVAPPNIIGRSDINRAVLQAEHVDVTGHRG